MARYKRYDYGQSKLIPVHFDRQVLPGTFEHTPSYLIEHECDPSWFEERHRNEETGAPARRLQVGDSGDGRDVGTVP